MTTWPINVQRFGPNHAPILHGLSSANAKDIVPVAVDPITGALLLEVSNNNTEASLFTGQKTVNTTAVQITSSSNPLTNGMIVKAPTTNASNVYVGLTGVTTVTGDILEPGETRGYAVNNTNLLYIISVASTTDKISWSAN